MKKTRENWIDISKGIAIIATIIGHVSLIPWEPYRKIIFSFHMPLFFVVAGYTAKELFNKTTIKKNIFRLLIPYFVVAMMTGVLSIFQGSDLKTEVLRLFWASGVPATYGPGRPVFSSEYIPILGALWFLPCLFCAKLMFSPFLVLTKQRKMWVRILGVLIISGAGYLIGQRHKLPFGLDIAMFAFVFLFAGYLFKKYGGISKKTVVLGAVLVVFWYLSLRCNALEMSARYYREFPFCVLTTFGAIAASFLIFFFSSEILDKIRYVSNFLIYCGRNSLIILFIHFLEAKFVSWDKVAVELTSIISMPTIIQGAVIAFLRVAFCVFVCFLYTMVKDRMFFVRRSQENEELK